MTDIQLNTLAVWDALSAEHPHLSARQLAEMVCLATGVSYIDLIDTIRLAFNQQV